MRVIENIVMNNDVRDGVEQNTNGDNHIWCDL